MIRHQVIVRAAYQLAAEYPAPMFTDAEVVELVEKRSSLVLSEHEALVAVQAFDAEGIELGR